MTNPKKPGLFKRLFKIGKKVAGDAVRGTVKAFPGGGLFYQVAALVRHWLGGEPGKPLPHSPVSVLVQLAWIALIFYGVVKNQIPILDALDLFGFEADDFKNFFAAPDTLR